MASWYGQEGIKRSMHGIGVDFGRQPGHVSPITEKRTCIYHFLPPSAPNILACPPNTYFRQVYSSETLLQPLLLLPKKVVKIIPRTHYLAHTASLFKDYSLLTITDLYKLHYWQYVSLSQRNSTYHIWQLLLNKCLTT